jgi:hypothetical protein
MVALYRAEIRRDQVRDKWYGKWGWRSKSLSAFEKTIGIELTFEPRRGSVAIHNDVR